MNAIVIQHDSGAIKSIDFLCIITKEYVDIPVSTDAARLRKFAAHKGNGGKVAREEYERSTMVYENRLIVATCDGRLLNYPSGSALLDAAEIAGIAIDLIINWRSGKYRVEGRKLVIDLQWQEPAITIMTVDAAEKQS